MGFFVKKCAPTGFLSVLLYFYISFTYFLDTWGSGCFVTLHQIPAVTTAVTCFTVAHKVPLQSWFPVYVGAIYTVRELCALAEYRQTVAS